MEARWQFSRLGWAFAGFFLVSAGAQMVSTLAVIFLDFVGILSLNMDAAMLLSQFSMYGIGFPVFYLLIKRIPAWEKSDPNPLGAGQMILWVVFCFGVTYIGNFMGQFLMRAIGGLNGHLMENPVDTMVMEMSSWTMFASTVIIAPVMEELMFRKLLLDRTVQYGQKTAVLVSGISFGLFHGNFFQFFYACAIGMVFAYLYTRTGRLRYCILLHMMINFVGGFLSLLLVQGMADQQPIAFMGMYWNQILMIGSMIAAIVLACIYGRRLVWFPAWADLPDRGLWRTILLAPGVLVFCVIMGAMFVLGG